jgi:hypothetical protein
VSHFTCLKLCFLRCISLGSLICKIYAVSIREKV